MKNLNFHEKRSKKEQSPTKYYFYKRLRESSGTSESGSLRTDLTARSPSSHYFKIPKIY